MANITPLPKVNPPATIYKDIGPISLTPITANVFESLVTEWVDDTIVSNVDPNQFGALAGTSTTDLSFERRGSVVVSTPAYHADDRGSNPARTRRDY